MVLTAGKICPYRRYPAFSTDGDQGLAAQRAKKSAN
jgi:hypothetical protein